MYVHAQDFGTKWWQGSTVTEAIVRELKKKKKLGGAKFLFKQKTQLEELKPLMTVFHFPVSLLKIFLTSCLEISLEREQKCTLVLAE